MLATHNKENLKAQSNLQQLAQERVDVAARADQLARWVHCDSAEAALNAACTTDSAAGMSDWDVQPHTSDMPLVSRN
jgi:hypothetical protein